MTRDLENELREAMAEHVGDVSARDSLAADARRGYRRKVRVRVAVVSAVAAAVVVVAGMPVYQSFRPEPVGAPRATNSGTPAGGQTLPSQRPLQGAGLPSDDPRTGPPKPQPPASSAPGRSPHGGGQVIPSLLGYVPSGVRLTKPCKSARAADRHTTSCRWSGPGGIIELKVVRGREFGGPADLGDMPAITTPARVHDQPALRGVWSETGAQVSWIERPKLGVWLGVSASLTDQLMRIAEGVRVPS
jgi:hypothetical protein